MLKAREERGKGRVNRIILIIAFFSFSISVCTLFAVGTNPKPAEEKNFDFWKAVFSKNPFPEKPTQPIKYSHKTHAGTLGIDCKFCHYYAEKSKYAGVPAVDVCMGCHRYVATVMQNPEVQKLFKYYEEKKNIPWVRVHDLPEFVRFSHRIHLNAGVDCISCHGDVAQMETAQRVSPLSMDWCLQCHKQQKASTECHVCHY